MKYIKLLFVSVGFFALSGCGTEAAIDQIPPRIVMDAEIKCESTLCIQADFNNSIYGIDQEGNTIPCVFDLQAVDFNEPGTYRATCTVEDEDGDSATFSFPINVEEENHSPVVQMNFSDFLPVKLGEPVFFHEWVFGVDEEDGTIPCELDLENVDLQTPGTYTAECEVEDEDGDVETASFDIKVEDKTPPKVEKMESHQNQFPVHSTIDFYSNILITDNYDTDLDIDIDDNLVLYDRAGIYDVMYIVTDDAGNETELVVAYELICLTTPTFFEEITTDQSHIWIDYEVLDPDGAFIRLDVMVEIVGEPEPFYVDSFFDVTYDIEIPGVPSNTPFKVTLTYTYDVGESAGERQRRLEQEIMSDSWEIPEMDIINTQTTLHELEFDVTMLNFNHVIDPCEIIVRNGLSGEIVFQSTNGPQSLQSFLVSDLEINTLYFIDVEYSYDLLDGNGVIFETVHVEVVTELFEIIRIYAEYTSPMIGEDLIILVEIKMAPEMNVTDILIDFPYSGFIGVIFQNGDTYTIALGIYSDDAPLGLFTVEVLGLEYTLLGIPQEVYDILENNTVTFSRYF